MNVQLTFDSANQQRLLRLIERLKEIGLVKFYTVSEKPELHESGRQWLDFLIKKDETGALSRMPSKTLENITKEAKVRILPYPFLHPKEEQEALITAIAALLYDRSYLSANSAATFADMSKADFIRKLGQFQVSAFGETVEEINAL